MSKEKFSKKFKDTLEKGRHKLHGKKGKNKDDKKSKLDKRVEAEAIQPLTPPTSPEIIAERMARLKDESHKTDAFFGAIAARSTFDEEYPSNGKQVSPSNIEMSEFENVTINGEKPKISGFLPVGKERGWFDQPESVLLTPGVESQVGISPQNQSKEGASTFASTDAARSYGFEVVVPSLLNGNGSVGLLLPTESSA